MTVKKLAIPTRRRENKVDDVVVHVRFLPNADIASIDRKPEYLTKREWFDLLYKEAIDFYSTFAGGRGFYRMPLSCFEAIMAQLEEKKAAA